MSVVVKPMLLAEGTSLGPYRIVRHIGSGGMGDVYRAVDTRLERTVAIKVLPPRFSIDAERRQRFEREARLVANLHHPHVCALFDVGREGDLSYLVMEFLHGETLGDRLARGALPIEQALRHAIDVGGALDRAHREGIVHRDLKPSNIFLTKHGAKLLDFGLAKLVEKPGAEQSDEQSPTASGSSLESEIGALLGTLPYMAPEQLEGKAVDARTDVFAFGLVLYQMITGRRAFRGDSKASLIAATLTASPPAVSSMQPMSSPALDRVVRLCLEKDPAERWQSAHDLVSELRWIASEGDARVRPSTSRWSRHLKPMGAVLGLVGATAIGYVAGHRRAPDATLVEPLRVSVLMPPRSSPVWPTYPIPPVLSPDGRRLAFVVSMDERSSLWVRPLDAPSAQPLTGTDGAWFPFWSPDSQSLGFFAGGALKKIPVTGGAAVRLCDAPTPRGGSWGANNVILFAASASSGIQRVSSAGGDPIPATTVRLDLGESQHIWPQFLPDGKHFLFVAGSPQQPLDSRANAVYVGTLGSPNESKRLFGAGDKGFRAWDRRVIYAAGRLLYRPQTTLLAQPFDMRRLDVAGEAVPVAEDVQTYAATDSAIVYQEGDPEERFQLQWMERSGKTSEALGLPVALGLGRISPDGRTVAMERTDPRTGNVDIWLYEMARATWTRLTTSPGRDRSPVFSPDGQHVVYDSDRSGHYAVYRRTRNGGGEEETLFDSVEGTSDFPADFSPDGKWLAVSHLEMKPREDWDVRIVSLTGDRKVVPFATGEARQFEPRFSPNGRLLAYLGNESGRQEAYVCSYPDGRTRLQASASGASWLLWRPDGRELVYRDLRGRFLSVAVSDGPGGLTIGAPQSILDAAPVFARAHDFSRDGSRILVSTSAEKEAPPITLLYNWTSELPHP